jgi:hypothetical protein
MGNSFFFFKKGVEFLFQVFKYFKNKHKWVG